MGGRETHGRVEPRFELVARQFDSGFARGIAWGEALCVWHDGQVVVDLWGGLADQSERRPWQADTLVTVFSVTKGLVALCFAMLADRGELDYDAPVASYWPAFAAAGKEAITVRTLLNHRAGLIGIDQPIALDQLASAEELDQVLAEQRPRWTPGTDQGYHGVTFGLYAAALFRHITGRSLGGFVASEIAGPLEADVYLGLPEALAGRTATVYPATRSEVVLKVLPKLLFHRGTEGRVYRQVMLGGDTAVAFRNPRELGARGIGNFNLPRVRAMELAWGGAMASARGLCRVYAALAAGGTLGGVRLLSTETIAAVAERQSWSDRDRVLRKPIGWSQGFVKEDLGLFSPNTTSFGHPGAGGSLGWCDPDNRLAIGFVTGKMDHHIRSPRALALCRAIYQSLGLGR